MKQHTTKSTGYHPDCDCLWCKLLRAGVCDDCATGIWEDAENGVEDPRDWRACPACLEVIKHDFE